MFKVMSQTAKSIYVCCDSIVVFFCLTEAVFGIIDYFNYCDGNLLWFLFFIASTQGDLSPKVFQIINWQNVLKHFKAKFITNQAQSMCAWCGHRFVCFVIFDYCLTQLFCNRFFAAHQIINDELDARPSNLGHWLHMCKLNTQIAGIYKDWLMFQK